MLKNATLFLATAMLMFSLSAKAQSNNTNIEKLDLLKTCVTAEQKDTAEKVLNFMFSYRWWNIKNMMSAIHPDYAHWHASRVYNAVVTPEDKWDALPYKKGIVTRETFLSDLAMVAYTNDVTKYIVDIKRAECLGADTVVLSSIFNGTSVFRNPEGYVTHEVKLENIPTRFTIMVKDGLIYRDSIDLEDTVTVELWKKIKAAIASTPAMAPDESTKTTYKKILEKFEAEAGIVPSGNGK